MNRLEWGSKNGKMLGCLKTFQKKALAVVRGDKNHNCRGTSLTINIKGN